ncbi:MAG: hypothetical protein K2J62_00540 [Bacteroidales bacterium]|nr:hypothetical protein [Bacteroidales bacterium]
MRRLFHTLLVLVVFASCNKPADDTLEKITDTIVGRYMCKSATIQGYQLDLDGNGIVSDDVIAEFERFEAAFWAIRDRPVRISPVKEYGQVANINIEIPKQRVNYDKRTGEYLIKIMSGSSMYICFRYLVDESGKIVAWPYNEGNSILGWEDDDMIEFVDYRDNSAKEIILDQKGGFQALIDCTFYDFATDKIITVPVLFVYERVSYSLY